MDWTEYNDSLGRVLIPRQSYYGPQTQRARENFPISGMGLPRELISAVALIKQCAAQTNREFGLLPPDKAEAVIQAAAEILSGGFADQFVVDVFQTGSGTSTNMNVNEVIAVRANEILTGTKQFKTPVHPNDHVNLCQSSNDVIPSAIHIAALSAMRKRLMPCLLRLWGSLVDKSKEFNEIWKIGRTHLQDAVPITLGQEFSGYARQMELGLERLEGPADRLRFLALGGTAVGTGLNAHPGFAARTIARIAAATGIDFRETANHFEAQAACDTAVETSGQLKTLAMGLMKIANDIRWLSSGPRCGLGEIILPSLQPGSSIMPGKVNPVIPEAVMQVCAQVAGNDTTIALAGGGGTFELNTMLPVIAHNLMQSITILANAAEVFAAKCIEGIAADRERCEQNIEKSLALVTHLVPYIGYDKAAEIARKAFETGKTVKTVALEEGIMAKDEINRLFSVQ
ncbi:MAG: class II fumarate hydratase [Thermodesulfobacteriota bacterium]